MIHLLHGTALIDSRKHLEEIKRNYPSDSVRAFNSKEIEYSSFSISLNSPSLFSDKELVVVEGKIDHSQIDFNAISVDLVIWIGEKLRSNDGLLKAVEKAEGTVVLFEEKIDSSIFAFLDAVVSRNRVNSLREYQILLDSRADPIYIQTMLVWQFRMLLVPELASGFVRKKVDRVVQNFDFDDLQKIYYGLLLLEVQLKTGEGIPSALLQQFISKITK